MPHHLHMPDPHIIAQGTIFRSPYLYASHPHAVVASDDDIVVVFNQTRRLQVIFHPPHDPEYRNFITRSSDGGGHWSAPQAVPDYRSSGTECAGLTSLPGGRVLLNQWRNRWYPLGLAKAGVAEPVTFPFEFATELIASAELETGQQISGAAEDHAPWARGHGTSFVHVSEDDGRSFTHTAVVDTGPYHGGYGLRGAVLLPDQSLLLPLNDIPEFRTIFTVTSLDGGRSWANPRLVAHKEGHLFTEPAIVRMASGALLCVMRDDVARIMYSCRSEDDGASWSAPQLTGIDGYPPHLLALPDGRLLCTYGMRQPEYSIRAVLSDDDGKTWSVADPVMIRRQLPNRDLGYPATVSLNDGAFFTVYYCQDGDGITGVEFTRWRL